MQMLYITYLLYTTSFVTKEEVQNYNALRQGGFRKWNGKSTAVVTMKLFLSVVK